MVDEVAQGLFYRVIYCSNHKLTRRAQGTVRLRRRFLAAQKQQKLQTKTGSLGGAVWGNNAPGPPCVFIPHEWTHCKGYISIYHFE